MPRRGNTPHGDMVRGLEEMAAAMETMPATPANNPVFIPEDQVFHTPVVEERPVDPRPVPVDPIYERQQPLGLACPDVILIGAGGIGCWIALSLALGGIKYLTIFDGDVISTHNLNRFPLPMGSVGSLKSEALANWLRTLRPDAEIVARGQFDIDIHNPRGEWLVCATDSLKSRRMCYKFAMELDMRYLEVGADGERWTLSPSPPEFSTENESQPGYQTVPVHVGPCMMAGAAAAYYVLHNTVPLDSYAGKWEGQWLSVISSPETPSITCWCCGTFKVPLEGGLISMIRHYRERTGATLVDAKSEVDRWFAEARGVPEVENLAEVPDPEFTEVDNGEEE